MEVVWNVDRFEIDDATRARFKKLHPDFDTELFKMETWYLANPRKRKKNIGRFIVNWLKGESAKVKKVPQTMRKQTEEFNERFKQAAQEAAPPPPEWREMMNSLKRTA